MGTELYAEENYADMFDEINRMGALSRADKGQIAFLVTCFGTKGFRQQVNLLSGCTFCLLYH